MTRLADRDLTIMALDAVAALRVRVVELEALLRGAVDNANEPRTLDGRSYGRAMALLDLALGSAEHTLDEADQLSRTLNQRFRRERASAPRRRREARSRR